MAILYFLWTNDISKRIAVLSKKYMEQLENNIVTLKEKEIYYKNICQIDDTLYEKYVRMINYGDNLKIVTSNSQIYLFINDKKYFLGSYLSKTNNFIEYPIVYIFRPLFERSKL